MPEPAEPTCQDLPPWLLSPEHASRMGGALWVFLWLWREGKPGQSPHVRHVGAEGAVRVEEIAEALGLPERTVKRHLALLREAGYLTTWKEWQGFSALVSIWDSSRAAGGESAESGAKNGPTLPPGRVGPKMAPHSDLGAKYGPMVPPVGAESGAIFGPNQNPPGPPLKEEDLRLQDKPGNEGSSSSSSSLGFHNVPTTAKRARIVPLHGQRDASPERPVVVAGGPSVNRLRHEQAITHLLGRIQEWERPEQTRALMDALCQVPLTHLHLVFEQVWRFHRTRNKAQENPAGWWAHMLVRSAQECLRGVKGEEDYG